MIVLPVLAAAWYAGSRLASSSHQLSSAPPPMANGTAAPPQSRQFSPSPPVKTVSGLPEEPSAASPSTRIPEAQATPQKQIVRIPRQFQALAERLKTRRTFSEVQQFWERNKWWDKAFQNAMRQALSSPGVDPVLARWSEKVLKDLKAQKIKTDTWRTIVKDADADTVNELVDLYDEDGSFEHRSGIELGISLIESDAGLKALGDLIVSDAPIDLRKVAAFTLAETRTPETSRILDEARAKLAASRSGQTIDTLRRLGGKDRTSLGDDLYMIEQIDELKRL
jgi:hypothetical protein